MFRESCSDIGGGMMTKHCINRQEILVKKTENSEGKYVSKHFIRHHWN